MGIICELVGHKWIYSDLEHYEKVCARHTTKICKRCKQKEKLIHIEVVILAGVRHEVEQWQRVE